MQEAEESCCDITVKCLVLGRFHGYVKQGAV